MKSIEQHIAEAKMEQDCTKFIKVIGHNCLRPSHI